jgi:hypothetical protein
LVRSLLPHRGEFVKTPKQEASVKYLNRKQATDFLRDNGLIVGDGFLAREAMLGRGPLMRYSGRHPVYSDEDLTAWIEERLSAPVRSPAEAGRGWPAARGRGAAIAEPPAQAPTRRARPYRKRRRASVASEAPADVSAA